MNFADFLIAGFAVWQIVEVIHHSALARPLREWANHKVSAGSDWSDPYTFYAEAMLCPFCLSHWVALVVTFWACIGCCGVPMWLIWTFAVARLANLGNDLSYSFTRTPKLDEGDEDDADNAKRPE